MTQRTGDLPPASLLPGLIVRTDDTKTDSRGLLEMVITGPSMLDLSVTQARSPYSTLINSMRMPLQVNHEPSSVLKPRESDTVDPSKVLIRRAVDEATFWAPLFGRGALGTEDAALSADGSQGWSL